MTDAALESARIVTVLQARCSSRRLPGKVLRDLGGRPMVLRQIERVARAASARDLVLATSVETSDDPLAEACEAAGVRVHRGSLDDVLDRFIGAMGDADHVVRLTGDCPLSDPAVIDLVAARHLAEGNDYTTNALRPSFPHGLDVEIARADALRAAAAEATDPAEREHVMPFLHRRPGRFRIGHVACERYLWDHRWTVDEAEDLEVVRALHRLLGDGWADAGFEDVLRLAREHPEVEALNAHLAEAEAPSGRLRERRP